MSKDNLFQSVAEQIGISSDYIQKRMADCIVKSGPGSDDERHTRFYFALALNCLIEEKPLLCVCERYRLNSDDLAKLQKDCANHGEVMSLFFRKMGSHYIATATKSFCERLYLGVSGNLCNLMFISSLNCDMIEALFNAGLKDVQSVAKKSYMEVEAIIRQIMAQKLANVTVLSLANLMQLAKGWLSDECKDLTEEEIGRLIVN